MSEQNKITERQLATIRILRLQHPELKSSSDAEVFAYILKNSDTGTVYKGFEYLNKTAQCSDTKNFNIIEDTKIKNKSCESSVFENNVAYKADFFPKFHQNTKNKKETKSIQTAKKQLPPEETVKIALQNKISGLQKELNKTKSQQGIIGKSWDGIKNLTGFGAGSDKVMLELEEVQKELAEVDKNPKKLEKVYKQVTGKELTKEELTSISKDKSKVNIKAESTLKSYQEGQKEALDITADVASGVVAAGAYTLAAGTIVAAPFTGGATLAVTAGALALATAGGSAVKVGIKYADAKTGGREYDTAGKDVVTGAVNGVLAPVTMGLGGAVGKAVSTRVGVQAVKEGAAAVSKDVAEQTVKQTAKQTIKQTTAKALSKGAEAASVGGAYGAPSTYVQNGVDTGHWADADAAKAAGKGLIGGAVAGIGFGVGIDGAKFATKTAKIFHTKTVLKSQISADFKEQQLNFKKWHKDYSNLSDTQKKIVLKRISSGENPAEVIADANNIQKNIDMDKRINKQIAIGSDNNINALKRNKQETLTTLRKAEADANENGRLNNAMELVKKQKEQTRIYDNDINQKILEKTNAKYVLKTTETTSMKIEDYKDLKKAMNKNKEFQEISKETPEHFAQSIKDLPKIKANQSSSFDIIKSDELVMFHPKNTDIPIKIKTKTTTQIINGKEELTFDYGANFGTFSTTSPKNGKELEFADMLTDSLDEHMLEITPLKQELYTSFITKAIKESKARGLNGVFSISPFQKNSECIKYFESMGFKAEEVPMESNGIKSSYIKMTLPEYAVATTERNTNNILLRMEKVKDFTTKKETYNLDFSKGSKVLSANIGNAPVRISKGLPDESVYVDMIGKDGKVSRVELNSERPKEINGKLYVYNPIDSKITSLKLSPKDFERLFPKDKDYTIMKQGKTIGNCYMVSSLNAMMYNKQTRLQVFDLFETTQKGDIVVRFPNHDDYPIIYNDGKLNIVGTTEHIDAVPGIQMIEQSYAKLKQNETSYTFIDNPELYMNTDNVVNLVGAGGLMKDILEEISGKDAKFTMIKEFRVMDNPTTTDPSSKNKTIMLQSKKDEQEIEKILNEKSKNPDNIIMTAGTNMPNSITDKANSKWIYPERSLVYKHAYAVKSVDTKNKTVTITNPWDTSINYEIKYQDLYDYFTDIEFLDYTK